MWGTSSPRGNERDRSAAIMPKMPTPQSETDRRWAEMRAAVGQAQRQPLAVMETVGVSATRSDAAAALAVLFDLDQHLSDQLLDLQISAFVGHLRD